jgi:hypothetical protein
MSQPVSLGDVYRIYVKPSLGGLLVTRKKRTRQTSPAVEASKKRLRDFKGKVEAPSKKAHKKCIDAGAGTKKLVYVKDIGYVEKPVCPMKDMIGFLRTQMEEVQKEARSHKGKPLKVAEAVEAAGKAGIKVPLILQEPTA